MDRNWLPMMIETLSPGAGPAVVSLDLLNLVRIRFLSLSNEKATNVAITYQRLALYQVLLVY